MLQGSPEIPGRGKIGGHVAFVGWLDDNLIELAGPIRGAQRGNNRSGVTRAAFAIQLAGTANRGGDVLDMRVSQKLVAEIDAGGVMTGTWTQKACIEGSGCETFRVPAGPTVWSNGHWTLELDVALITIGESGPGRRLFTTGGLTGTARIRLVTRRPAISPSAATTIRCKTFRISSCRRLPRSVKADRCGYGVSSQAMLDST